MLFVYERHSLKVKFKTFVEIVGESKMLYLSEKRLRVGYVQNTIIIIIIMWNLKCTIIPVIIGATWIVTRSLRINLEALPRKHSIDSLQKTAILGTSHIIQKVLQCEA